jgi:hypothetical protein
VIRIGSTFRVQIGTVLLRADEAVLRIGPDVPGEQAPTDCG